jgi:hypothetical protein
MVLRNRSEFKVGAVLATYCLSSVSYIDWQYCGAKNFSSGNLWFTSSEQPVSYGISDVVASDNNSKFVGKTIALNERGLGGSAAIVKHTVKIGGTDTDVYLVATARHTYGDSGTDQHLFMPGAYLKDDFWYVPYGVIALAGSLGTKGGQDPQDDLAFTVPSGIYMVPGGKFPSADYAAIYNAAKRVATRNSDFSVFNPPSVKLYAEVPRTWGAAVALGYPNGVFSGARAISSTNNMRKAFYQTSLFGRHHVIAFNTIMGGGASGGPLLLDGKWAGAIVRSEPDKQDGLLTMHVAVARSNRHRSLADDAACVALRRAKGCAQ